MKEKTYLSRNDRRMHLDYIGANVLKHWGVYSLLLTLISLFEIFMIVRSFFLLHFDNPNHVCYFISYFFLLITSIATLIFILVVRKKEGKEKLTGIIVHSYSSAITMWSVLVSCIDLIRGNTAIVFLTVSITLAGIVLVDPLFYAINMAISVATIFIVNSFQHFEFFKDSGYIINFFIFVIMGLFVAYRHYRFSITESKAKTALEKLSYTDQLTGLGNETKYYSDVDKLKASIEKKNAKFAIAIMDLNNLKWTDDKYGHLFGAHLIATAGSFINTIFDTSKCYHIGGDEFAIIIENDNLKHLEKVIEYFKEELSYKTIVYRGEEIVLSVAIGYSKFDETKTYDSTYQEADDNMYKHKLELKTKYNFPSR